MGGWGGVLSLALSLCPSGFFAGFMRVSLAAFERDGISPEGVRTCICKLIGPARRERRGSPLVGEERGGGGALSYLTVKLQIIYILIGLKIQLSGGPEGTRSIESNPNQNLNYL